MNYNTTSGDLQLESRDTGLESAAENAGELRDSKLQVSAGRFSHKELSAKPRDGSIPSRVPRWVKNKLHGLMLRHGSEAIRRWIWNREYAAGRWQCLDSMSKDCVLPYLNAHARGGRILDIGCGPGAIGEALDPAAYRHYFGVDISDVAIEKARARNSRVKNVYTAGDMWTFNPNGTYEVIFFGDSLYNFSFSDGKKILCRYASYLSEEGVFVIRTWVSLDRARAIITLIESDCDVIEKESFAYRSQLIVIVFKPKVLIRDEPRTREQG